MLIFGMWCTSNLCLLPLCTSPQLLLLLLLLLLRSLCLLLHLPLRLQHVPHAPIPLLPPLHPSPLLLWLLDRCLALWCSISAESTVMVYGSGAC
jgi:hypothetical protein